MEEQRSNETMTKYIRCKNIVKSKVVKEMNLLHLLENTFDRKRISANPSPNPNPNCNSNLNPKP